MNNSLSLYVSVSVCGYVCVYIYVYIDIHRSVYAYAQICAHFLQKPHIQFTYMFIYAHRFPVFLYKMMIYSMCEA